MYTNTPPWSSIFSPVNFHSTSGSNHTSMNAPSPHNLHSTSNSSLVTPHYTNTAFSFTQSELDDTYFNSVNTCNHYSPPPSSNLFDHDIIPATASTSIDCLTPATISSELYTDTNNSDNHSNNSHSHHRLTNITTPKTSKPFNFGFVHNPPCIPPKVSPHIRLMSQRQPNPRNHLTIDTNSKENNNNNNGECYNSISNSTSVNSLSDVVYNHTYQNQLSSTGQSIGTPTHTSSATQSSHTNELDHIVDDILQLCYDTQHDGSSHIPLYDSSLDSMNDNERPYTPLLPGVSPSTSMDNNKYTNEFNVIANSLKTLQSSELQYIKHVMTPPGHRRSLIDSISNNHNQSIDLQLTNTLQSTHPNNNTVNNDTHAVHSKIASMINDLLDSHIAAKNQQSQLFHRSSSGHAVGCIHCPIHGASIQQQQKSGTVQPRVCNQHDIGDINTNHNDSLSHAIQQITAIKQQTQSLPYNNTSSIYHTPAKRAIDLSHSMDHINTNIKKPRSNRSSTTDIPSQIWQCPNLNCDIVYKTTSSKSIQRHQQTCKHNDSGLMKQGPTVVSHDQIFNSNSNTNRNLFHNNNNNSDKLYSPNQRYHSYNNNVSG